MARRSYLSLQRDVPLSADWISIAPPCETSVDCVGWKIWHSLLLTRDHSAVAGGGGTTARGATMFTGQGANFSMMPGASSLPLS